MQMRSVTNDHADSYDVDGTVNAVAKVRLGRAAGAATTGESAGTPEPRRPRRALRTTIVRASPRKFSASRAAP